MERRRIGSLEVTVCGLGCNNFGGRVDYEGTEAVVRAALDAGVNFFDTADIYGNTKSEEFLGRALRGKRERVVIATKFGMAVGGDEARSGASPRWIRIAVEDSLRRLQTDYIDLYQQHAPDPTTPLEDTMGTLHDLVQEGKVREIGCSNFTAELLDQAGRIARDSGTTSFVGVQNYYNMLNRGAETDALPVADRAGLAFLPYFPLANGLLTGKYRRGRPLPENTRIVTASEERRAALLSDANLDLVERLADFGTARECSILEVTMAWFLARPQIASVIAGATKPEQVRANAAAVAKRLSDGDFESLNALISG